MDIENDILQNIEESIIKNDISLTDKYELWLFLEKNIKEHNRCLAVVIFNEITENKKESMKTYKSLCIFVLEQCFWKTETGCMDASKLSRKKIGAFITEVMEKFNLKEIEKAIFIQLLEIGLVRLEERGMLNFIPDRMLSRKYIASKVAISYIQNPYTKEETEKFMEWAKEHPADVRTQAVSLWFTKGLTLTDIVTLTKKGCWGDSKHVGCIEREGMELFRSTARSQIVRRALDTHPKNVQYVFSVSNSDYSGWERLTERGLLLKLKAICKKTGIPYKPILINEAISLK